MRGRDGDMNGRDGDIGAQTHSERQRRIETERGSHGERHT